MVRQKREAGSNINWLIDYRTTAYFIDLDYMSSGHSKWKFNLNWSSRSEVKVWWSS